MPIQCPACGATNPDHSWQCACGHYFVTTMPKPSDSLAEPAAPPSTMLAAASEPQTRRLWFRGAGGSLLEIYILNFLLTFLTLGVYYFWGKVKVRQYLYGQTEFEGDRFGYHGTGKELLIGWLKALALFGGFFALLALNQMLWQGKSQAILGQVLFYGGLLLLIPIAVVGSQRYRLSRTSWRGIRFSFRGHTTELMRNFLRDGLLTLLTGFLYYPFFQNNLREFLAHNSYYGSEPFDYNGEGWELFKMYMLTLLLILPTLGLYWFWYTAKKQRYYWAHTEFGKARFRSTVTGEGLAEIKITNLLLIIFTLGLGYPLARIREARFQADHLFLDGPLDLDRIRQQAEAASATGDALNDLMDVSLLDMDLGF
ncbi:MAG: DUF898 domain-containing protein [Acidobacteria bacterium]|nr:DUF898 domain-containing protein [Acidobacteriota bacterium]